MIPSLQNKPKGHSAGQSRNHFNLSNSFFDLPRIRLRHIGTISLSVSCFPSRPEMIACMRVFFKRTWIVVKNQTSLKPRPNPFMKKLLTFLAMVVLASFFSSCTTTGPLYNAVKDTFPPPAADAGRIFIYRDAIYNPSKTPAVLLNGEQAGLSKAQGFFYVDRPAGEYNVVLSGESGPPASFTLSPGQILYVRIGLHSNLTINHQYPEVVDATIAQREIVSCKYTGDAQK
jgi:hypothetical protein